MVEKITMFRLTIGVCFSCVIVSVLIYLYALPFSSGPDSYGTPVPVNQSLSRPIKKPLNGLYSNSKVVQELSKDSYRIVTEGKVATAVLYYAAWCGHCR